MVDFSWTETVSHFRKDKRVIITFIFLSGIKKLNKWEKQCVVTGYKSLELNTPCKVGIEFKVTIKTEEFAGTWQVYALGGFFLLPELSWVIVTQLKSSINMQAKTCVAMLTGFAKVWIFPVGYTHPVSKTSIVICTFIVVFNSQPTRTTWRILEEKNISCLSVEQS